MKSNTQKIVFAALLTSLVCVATMIIRIPSPLKGYINLGDCVVLFCGWTLPSVYGLLAAGIGSALADLFTGYVVYAPVTLIIKSIMAFIAYSGVKLLWRKCSIFLSTVISGILAEISMVLGYYVFDGIMYGFMPSVANIPANAVQGVVGVVAGVLLYRIFDKNKIMQ